MAEQFRIDIEKLQLCFAYALVHSLPIFGVGAAHSGE